ncbi:hypothetical protein MTR67_039379 [Solanum verrucosum]|uniref:AWS domain-containing protein n=1 Tax=Solanum verrucosum TaxID=315347 RepID=A0AAF0ZR43_SOLVR|nr:hypothetical protein MTR67_039379 [Solanum verrucosum]
MHDKLHDLVAIIALVPALKFCLSETKHPVALHLASRHKKQREKDIAICECKYDASNPNSACVGRCLNLLTNIECTPGYCLCGETCRNQVN